MEVYDEVWIMKDNKPTKMYIYSKKASMGWSPSDIDFTYEVVRGFCGNNSATNPAIGCGAENMLAVGLN